MRPPIHLLISLILSAILYPVFNWKVFLIIVGGVIIDIDHYFWYILKYKKFNLIDCYIGYIDTEEKRNYKKFFGALFIFHTIEFLLILALLSFYFEFVLILMIGVLSHFLLDLIWHYFVPKCFISNHSIISWIIKNNPWKI